MLGSMQLFIAKFNGVVGSIIGFLLDIFVAPQWTPLVGGNVGQETFDFMNLIENKWSNMEVSARQLWRLVPI